MRRSRMSALMVGALDHLFSHTAMWCVAMLMAIVATVGMYLQVAREEVVMLPHNFMAIASESAQSLSPSDQKMMQDLETLQAEVDAVLSELPDEQAYLSPVTNPLPEEPADRDPFAGIVLPDEAAFLELSAIDVMPLMGPRFLTPAPDAVESAQTDEKLFWQSIGFDPSAEVLALDRPAENLGG